MSLEWRRDESYLISTERKRLDLATIHGFLSRTAWAAGIPLETVKRSLEHSIPFGVYEGRRQVGFARVITDCATFAYLADVFIDEEYRGKGLGKWLVETIASHPSLQGLRRFVLVTRDAQELYRKFGFEEVADFPTYMHRWDRDVYKRHSSHITSEPVPNPVG
jgi:N-acetylglutamate synthase-like GNAT family acetyltransferase